MYTEEIGLVPKLKLSKKTSMWNDIHVFYYSIMSNFQVILDGLEEFKVTFAINIILQ